MADTARKQRPEFRVGVGAVGEAVIDFTTRCLVFEPYEKKARQIAWVYMDGCVSPSTKCPRLDPLALFVHARVMIGRLSSYV